jgi:hypothetical protein
MKKRIQELDSLALDIEFLLISVIQGVALGVLASSSVDPLTSVKLSVLPYVITAFLFILIFWSGAILHAISFIDWPIDLYHSFLYFLASFIEIMAITHLTNPLLWFLFLFLFQVVAVMLYSYDLRMIRKRKHKFAISSSGKQLYAHILAEQKKELLLFIPVSLFFNIVAVLVFFFQKELFIQRGYHVIFIIFQLLFALLFLFQQMKVFQKRSQLLEQFE